MALATCFLNARGLTAHQPFPTSLQTHLGSPPPEEQACTLRQDFDTCCYSNTWLIFSLTHWKPRQIFTFILLCEFWIIRLEVLTAQHGNSRAGHLATAADCRHSSKRNCKFILTLSTLSFDVSDADVSVSSESMIQSKHRL